MNQTAAAPSPTFRFGALRLEAAEFGSQGSAILGIRDSGKSYTATALAEKLYDAGVPFVAFDPIGVWRFLRVPGKGKGYPIVVAGGAAGDLPLSPATAPAIVEAAMREGVSLVLDFFHIDMSKADWRRIVRDCVRLLLHRNKPHGLRHIFLEEAAEFAPQKVLDGEVYAEIEKLARMGGNSRLGYTLINQRAEEVNKAVLELCDNLFLHRQKGRNSLTALTKWLDVGGVKDSEAIIESMATLPQGECWAWLAGADHATRIKVPEKNSLHPDRRVMRGDDDAAPVRAVDVGLFVAAMQAALPQIEEEAKSADPKVWKAKVADLERRLKTAEAKAAAPSPNVQAADAIRREAFAAGAASRNADVARAHAEGFTEALERTRAALAGVQKPLAPPPPAPPAAAPAPVIARARPAPPPPPPTGEVSANDPLLRTALAVWPAKLTWGALAAACGRKARGGHFNATRKRLIEAGLIREEGGLVVPTDPPEIGGRIPADLLEQNLPQPAAKMFAFIRANPGVDLAALGDGLGMATHGGHWNSGMSVLRKNGLIEERGGGLFVPDELEAP